MSDATIMIVHLGGAEDAASLPGTMPAADGTTSPVIRFVVSGPTDPGARQPVIEGSGGSHVRLRMPASCGPGLSLNLAFQYAIGQGYEVVMVAPPGGIHPPRELCERLPRLAAGSLGAVWCSRPAGWQRLLKALAPSPSPELSASWSAYSTACLQQLPFTLNGRDSIFMTELAIQFQLSDFPTERLPAVTPDEPSPIAPSLRSAWRQALALLRYRFHSLGLLYQLNYDVRRQQTNYTPKFGFASSHEYALRQVPTDSTVTDLGAGKDAYLVDPLKAKGCRVYVADLAPITRTDVQAAYRLNLNHDPLPECVQVSDVVLLLDVIEHLNDPEQFLLDLRNKVAHTSARIIVTTPNIAFFITRVMLLFGQFNYGKSGILDRTHTRLYTYRSLRRALRQCGYVIELEQGVPAPFVKALGPTALASLLTHANLLLIKLSRSLFAYQIFVQLRADPVLDTIRQSDS